MLNGKVVLITGGTGSFGKKFVEVILRDFPYLIQISYLLENQRGFKKRGDSPTTFPQQFQLL